MANDIYRIDLLATAGASTVEVTDDGSGSDWLVLKGTYGEISEITLAWSTSYGQATSAAGTFWVTNSSGRNAGRLVVNGAIENVRGSDSADFIAGNELANILYGDQSATGVGGSDSISGGGGGDTIFGGAGADTIGGASGRDLIFGGTGDDTMSGGVDADTMEGGAGADFLAGGGDAGDTVSYKGSSAGTRLDITNGIATTGHGGDAEGDQVTGFVNVIGSAFNDVFTDTVKTTVAFGYNDNVFYGGAGNDLLTLGGGADRGEGGAGNDTLRGEFGRDRLFGGDGADQLEGGLGADTLNGGLGKDVLHGGGGADRFVFATWADSAAGANRDAIRDFSHSQGDKIDLHLIDAVPATLGDDAFAFRGTGAFTGAGQIRIQATTGGVLVQANQDADATPELSIFIAGVSTLVAGDFIL